MSPAKVAEYLAVMRAANCLDLNVSCADGEHFSAKLAPEYAGTSAAPFVDASGKAVNLDEGAPWNTREPESDGNELYRANFPGKSTEAD